MKNHTLAIKVDVDTYRGMKEGVPRLISILAGHNVKATFFIAMGPDNSGKAVFRFFTRRGFLKKMLRSNAVGMYGIRTALSGTLLPARRIARSFPGHFHALLDTGHEVGIHGWDHVRWHDKMPTMSFDEAREELEKAHRLYADIVGREPGSSAAPGWACSSAQLTAQDETGMLYHSDSRGESPFFPVMGGKEFSHLQIPTTLPTLDELLGIGELSDPDEVKKYYTDKISSVPMSVLTVHAETEGMSWADWFDGLLGELELPGVRFQRLRDIADNALKERENIPRCELSMGALPGRAGLVAIQKSRDYY